jgi:hypothetical protein
MDIDDIVKKLQPLTFAQGVSRDEQIRRIFLSLGIAIMLPMVSVFLIKDMLSGRIMEGIVVFGMVSLLCLLLFLLNRAKSYGGMVRTVVLLITFIEIYEFYTGGGNGGAFLWFFVLPSATIFLLGVKEGVFWVAGMDLCIAVMTFGKLGYPYSSDLSYRFFAVFTIVSFLSCCFELLREWYFRQLTKEKETVQKALDEIKLLKGLVPICSSCKKIRDDKGYWTQIEAYIKAYSDVEFSHGICPECAAKLYPTSSAANSTQPDDSEQQGVVENVTASSK